MPAARHNFQYADNLDGGGGYDLHVHTTASDGKLTPGEVLLQAVRLNLEGLAITDHDTVDGIGPAIEFNLKQKLALELIPGIEFNTEAGPNEIHILAYYLDYQNASLLQKLQELKRSRDERAAKMVQRLKRLGLPIELDRVREIAGGEVLGRPHVAEAMMEKGYVYSIKEAFARYLGYNQPAYVPRYKFRPEEAIALIKQCGGVSVLAHPGLIKDQRQVARIAEMGIDGVEVFYPEHSEQQTVGYLEMAQSRGLLVTGGSDFHGGLDERGKLGSIRLSRERIETIKNRLAQGAADFT